MAKMEYLGLYPMQNGIVRGLGNGEICTEANPRRFFAPN